MNYINDYFIALWNTMNSASPYLLLGFFFAGLIAVFFPKNKIQGLLGKPGWKTVVKASLIGVPLPLCSCGVVPTAIALKRRGADRSGIFSFLVSTPETGVDSILFTYGLLGPVMAIVRPVAAFITAIITGLASMLLPQKQSAEDFLGVKCSCCHGENQTVEKEICEDCNHSNKIFAAVHYGFWTLLRDVSMSLLVGLLLAALITTLVPKDFIEKNLDGTVGSFFLSSLFMLAIGIPMYVCATASTPMAAAMIMAGISPGAALVFLQVGPVTNIASLTVLRKEFGTKAIALFVGSIAVSSLIIGFIFDRLVRLYGYEFPMKMTHEHEHFGPLSMVCTVILTLLILGGVVSRLRDKFGKKQGCSDGCH
jgi:uncharacterized membrane protein YraQ (UPF0718 family)